MMRINKFLTPLALAALLAACSSEDELKTESIDMSYYYGNSDVEVKLSAGGRTTRASVENTDAALFTITGEDKLGIFMLATNKKGVNATEDDIDWAATGEDQWSVWIDNDSATATNDGAVTSINWAKTGQKYYYPIGNWYSYRFYGYYPRVEAVNHNNNQVSVDFTELDGTKDVIWGRSLGCNPAGTTDEQCRYSAQYFRLSGFSQAYPSLDLDHKMMRIQFYVQGLPDEDAGEGHYYDTANEMMVDTIEVINVPTTATLIVADREVDGNNGKISYNWTSNLANIGIRGDSLVTNPDGAFNKSESQIEGDRLKRIGQPMLLPVPDDDATAAGFTRYKVNVNLRNTSGEIFKSERPLDLVLPNETVFQHSKTYKVVLKIAGPKVVAIQATLAPWSDPVDAIQDLIFN